MVFFNFYFLSLSLYFTFTVVEMFSLNGVGGVADRHGGLKRGDQLLSVNGVNMQKIQKTKTKKIIFSFAKQQNNTKVQCWSTGEC